MDLRITQSGNYKMVILIQKSLENYITVYIIFTFFRSIAINTIYRLPFCIVIRFFLQF